MSSAPDGNNLLQVEHDYTGSDFSMNVKAVNPDPTDLSGIYIGNYLQSITKNLAVGIETLYQRTNFGGPMGLAAGPEISSSYLAKYTGTNKDWIATAQFQSSGILQSTYWQKLGEKLEVAADLQLIAAPQRRDAIATVGAKYSLRQATFRAQVDSTGKVSALLEQQLAPTFSFLVAGEIDHFKVCAASHWGQYNLFVDTTRSHTEHIQSRGGYHDRVELVDTRGGWGAATTVLVAAAGPCTYTIRTQVIEKWSTTPAKFGRIGLRKDPFQTHASS